MQCMCFRLRVSHIYLNGHTLSLLQKTIQVNHIRRKISIYVVKVWNKSGLCYSINEHIHPTMSVLIPGPNCDLPPENHYFLSCCMDGSISLWNADSGILLLRTETENNWLGMRWMNNSSFFTFNENGVYTWDIMQALVPFSHIL